MTTSLPGRVARIAQQILDEQHYIRPVDVLVGLGWVAAVNAQAWQQGRIEHLADLTASTPANHEQAIAELGRWARDSGLQPQQIPSVALTCDRRLLRFAADGGADLERAFSTHWYSPSLTERQREQLVAKNARPPELVVVSAVRSWTCALCQTPYDPGGVLLMQEAGPTCLPCADLDQLKFLPCGNTTLTRRAKRASRFSAVVVRWSRDRKRYERTGILADPSAIEQAEAACLNDAEVRQRRRAGAAERRGATDERFVSDLTAAVRAKFPACPADRAVRIARHAEQRSSGRIGRTRAGRDLDPDTVRLAVIASVRHEDTPYDELLTRGVARARARDQVREAVERVLDHWVTTDDAPARTRP